VSAAFILVNSIAGILGHLASVAYVPAEAAYWSAAAPAGGWVGADLGSRKLNAVWLRPMLGIVLVIAGFKMIFT